MSPVCRILLIMIGVIKHRFFLLKFCAVLCDRESCGDNIGIKEHRHNAYIGNTCSRNLDFSIIMKIGPFLGKAGVLLVVVSRLFSYLNVWPLCLFSVFVDRRLGSCDFFLLISSLCEY